MPRPPTSGSGALVGLLFLPWLLGGLAWWLLSPDAAQPASAPGPAPPGPAAGPPPAAAPALAAAVDRALEEARAEEPRSPGPVTPAEQDAGGRCVLEGWVLDDGGRPLTGVWVQVLPKGDPAPADAGRVRTAVVDAQGHFRFAPLGVGPWRIQVREPEQPAAMSEELGRLRQGLCRRTLVVPRRATLHWTLQDQHGRGIPDLTVRLTPGPAGDGWLTRTDDAGAVEVRFLASGRYRLRANGPGLRWEEELVLDHPGTHQETRRLAR